MKNLFISYSYENDIYTTNTPTYYETSHAVCINKETGFGNTIITGDDKKLENNHEIMALENHICTTKNYTKVTIINFRRVE